MEILPPHVALLLIGRMPFDIGGGHTNDQLANSSVRKSTEAGLGGRRFESCFANSTTRICCGGIQMKLCEQVTQLVEYRDREKSGGRWFESTSVHAPPEVAAVAHQSSDFGGGGSIPSWWIKLTAWFAFLASHRIAGKPPSSRFFSEGVLRC